MKTVTMQLLDRYAGPAACALLALAGRGAPAAAVMPPPRRILIIKLLGLGSIVLLAPMVKALRERWPAAAIDFFTLAENEAMVRAYCAVDRVVTIRRQSLPGFAAGTRRALGIFRAAGYDVVIDGEFLSRYTAIVTRMIGAPRRVGFTTAAVYRGDHLTDQVSFASRVPVAEQFYRLAGPLGVAPVAPVPLLSPRVPAGTAARAAAGLVAAGLAPGEPYLVLNPNVSDTSPWIDRRWPADYFRELALALRRQGERLVFIGNTAQADYTGEIAAAAGGISLAGQTTLAELLAVIDGARLLITTDSGPLHFAASLGVPTIALFGTESPELYGHHGPQQITLYAALPCSPCLTVGNTKLARCRENSRCLRELTPDRVLAAYAALSPRLLPRPRACREERA